MKYLLLAGALLCAAGTALAQDKKPAAGAEKPAPEQRRPVEVRAAERHEHELSAAHGDYVHLGELDGTRRPLLIERNDVCLSKVRNEQE